MDLTIYNCHIHTFTAEHIPDRFLPLGLVRAMRRPWLRKIILWAFTKWLPKSNKDAIARTGRFLARGAFDSQQKVFEYAQRQYPEGTRFIALPMDMEFMDAGKPKVQYEAQLKELAELRPGGRLLLCETEGKPSLRAAEDAGTAFRHPWIVGGR